ncbi:MAG: anti-sigma factor [Inquilinus sp.]|nr:anti-sigma factor [Inquilinus sp.]
MASPGTPVSADDLNAYVDDALDDARRIEVEAYIDNHREAAEMVAAYRHMNEGMRALFCTGALGEPPAALRPAAVARRAADRRRRRLAQAAAAVLLLLLGGGGGWALRDVLAPAPDPLVVALTQDAARAHRMYVAEMRHAVEVGAEEAHLFRWLSNRLGGEVRAPDLAGQGFRLVGGRLLPSHHGPAAQFMYENAEVERLTLYIRAIDGEDGASFRFVGEDGVNAFYWVDGQFGYALIGAVEREPLLRAARQVYADLTGG